ncbi:nucleotidyltransferase domain-containing protein [cf. Phormidesmis sp. LEGE 11477]|uniref:nucleotidyltransferase domain-containing protein n=1 Tax=cf. Phormidesmis sp. LEGE 11477 TaxID=1828680 RepID=UPI001881FCDD|nr:nucleotidyltransferase domain-containing protein [cf. Phormidesmis sp. LEGE 11477]MBE9059506.1 nucleotidyltransferase domain-containing protein [cf. Phormidesmis sp. LEGE 11477]
MNNSLVRTTKAIHAERYPGSEVIFLSGSIIRGESTPTSDLDLVVIFRRLENAYRESFRFDDWPVEAFVHDPETLHYFFDLDRADGVPSLANMVNEGVEVPAASDFSSFIKALARSVLAKGPPHWQALDVDNSRYAITDIVDDLYAPRSRAEQIASATVLFSQLANHFLRSRQLWSAKGKTIPRRLREVDPEFAVRFEESFQALFTTGRATQVITLAEEVLERSGGRLFKGHKLAAPPDWRQIL